MAVFFLHSMANLYFAQNFLTGYKLKVEVNGEIFERSVAIYFTGSNSLNIQR